MCSKESKVILQESYKGKNRISRREKGELDPWNLKSWTICENE